jgi:hypothetical protein
MSGKADCDALFRAVMPIARPLVDKFGEFYPFAMTMDRHSAIRALLGCPQ